MEQELSISNRTNIILWLFSGCMLIFVMVVVGGITRLTGSGLSITKWDVVTGTIPPLSEADWQQEFLHYTETPQFKHINSHFGIDDFKNIYWWEYIHRLLGRVIGIVFILPFAWFLFTKQLKGKLMLKCLVLFFMGGLQGFIGWYMVKSGLVNVPEVSHYRLALHLITAFMTFGLTFWIAFELIHTISIKLQGWHRTLLRFSIAAFIVTVIQIVYGAFVAGLKAGYIYNTWPLMGDKLIADSVLIAYGKDGVRALLNDMAGVQLMHRFIAVTLVGIIGTMFWFVAKNQKSSENKLSMGQLEAFNMVIIAVLLQFTLGVLTLLFHVPVVLGVLHQAMAFLLFTAVIYLIHRLKRKAASEA